MFYSEFCIQSRHYDAKKAQSQYEYVLVNSRIGLDITREQFEIMDLIVQSGGEKGQSIVHIVKSNTKSIPYSERHVYTLIAEQKLSFKKHDLKRAVRYSQRKHNIQKREYAAKIRTNRRYSDFLKEIAKYPFMNVVEMDTVESTNSGQHKCLLTLHYFSRQACVLLYKYYEFFLIIFLIILYEGTISPSVQCIEHVPNIQFSALSITLH